MKYGILINSWEIFYLYFSDNKIGISGANAIGKGISYLSKLNKLILELKYFFLDKMLVNLNYIN
jgi:hypothetical protein